MFTHSDSVFQFADSAGKNSGEIVRGAAPVQVLLMFFSDCNYKLQRIK